MQILFVVFVAVQCHSCPWSGSDHSEIGRVVSEVDNKLYITGHSVVSTMPRPARRPATTAATTISGP